MFHLLQQLHINDDVDAEFEFWKTEFVHAIGLAVLFTAAAGVMIALWPEDSGNAQVRAFVRDLWTLFIELGFWFGFLVGLLWSGAKRVGAGMAGTLPWQTARQLSPRAGVARRLGQAACCFAFGGMLLWFAQQLARFGDTTAAAALHALAPFAQISLTSALVFGVMTLALRDRGEKVLVKKEL